MNQSKEHSGVLQESLNRHHETTDVDFKRIVLTGIGLLGLMVLGLIYSGVVSSMFYRMSAQPGVKAEVFITPRPGELPPLPRLQSDPHSALVQLRNREDSILTGYSWVSEDSGLVRVPIEKAMELVVERGMLKSR